MSSLYIFDALSRAARQQVTKLGLTGSLYAEKGNCATFLVKIEGVLEGLFQDMVTIGTEESKVSRIPHHQATGWICHGGVLRDLEPRQHIKILGVPGRSLSLQLFGTHEHLPAAYIYEMNPSNNCFLVGKITKNS